MREPPNLEKLRPITEWEEFITDILVPECAKRRYDVDYEFLEDRWCYVIGHFDQDKFEIWQRFTDDFIKPFCQERCWHVEQPWEEDAVIFIQAPPPVEDSNSTPNVHQLNFFDLCPTSPKQINNYQYERRVS